MWRRDLQERQEEHPSETKAGSTWGTSSKINNEGTTKKHVEVAPH